MKKVLSIGQCNADNQQIGTMLKSNFSVEFEMADTRHDAIPKIQNQNFDLVLVNRILDANGEEGMDIIREFHSDPKFKSLPVMLVSNFEDSQKAAVAIGARPGFGKAAINDEATLEILKPFLER